MWLDHLTSLLTVGVSLAVPLLLAALGELIVERSGVINVGIEGMALAGALAGYAASCETHQALIGATCAFVAGAALAALAAWLCVRRRADQVVVGTAINILAVGLTGVFFRSLPNRFAHSVSTFHAIVVPVLGHLPFVGPAFFSETSLGYFAWLLVPLSVVFLFHTRKGLHLRAAGELPAAAGEAGARVDLLRTWALLWGGGLAGLAGAYLSIDYTQGFTEGMTAGRGFIALAVVILGRWSPWGVASAALLFGLADALHYQILSSGAADGPLDRLPYQFLQALPYLLTIGTMCLRSRLRHRPPAALGQP